LGNPKRTEAWNKWEDNVKIGIREIDYERTDWIKLVQDMIQ
jgi:hypothetical protein